MNKNIRHGDVSFHEISELPKNLKKVEHKGEWVAAYGEVTGHAHRVRVAEPDQMEVLQDETTGRFYLKLTAEATISHEEHKTITLLPGIYEKKQEREFDYFQLATRRVQD